MTKNIPQKDQQLSIGSVTPSGNVGKIHCKYISIEEELFLFSLLLCEYQLCFAYVILLNVKGDGVINPLQKQVVTMLLKSW